MLTADKISVLAQYCLLCVGFNMTVWAVADKYDLWGLYDYKKKQSWPARCMLCIPFWFCLIYTLAIASITGLWYLMAAPFITAGFTLKKATQK